MTPCSRRCEQLAAVGLVGIAAMLRLWHFDALPGGLLIDEGFNGVDVLRVLAGIRPIFFADNFGREPLFIYLQALSVAVLGQTSFALRIVSVAFGLLAVPMTYTVTRRMVGGNAALLAAAWMATATWALVFSRVGLRAIAVPFLVAACVYAFHRAATEEPARRAAALALAGGAALAAAIATYTAARFLPFVVLACVAMSAAGPRGTVGRKLAVLFVGAAAAGLLLLPLGMYFVAHPQDFFARAHAVSAFNPEWNEGSAARTLLRSLFDTLGAFNLRGDHSWDRNVSGLPMFDPLFGLAFVVGVGAALSGARRRSGGFLLLVWLLVMLVPNVVTALGVPNYLRFTGAMPAIAGLAGLGAMRLAQLVGAPHRVISVGVAGLIAWGTLWGVATVFVVWSGSAQRYYAFNQSGLDAVRVATEEVRAGRRVYVTGPAEPNPVLGFLGIEGTEDGYLFFDPRFARAYPPAGAPATVVVVLSDAGADEVSASYPGQPVVAVRDPAGVPSVTAIRFLGGGAPLGTRPIEASVGGIVDLVGYDMPRRLAPGDIFSAWLTAQARRSDGRDLVFFGHLVDRNERVWGRRDQYAARASAWREGDLIKTRFEMPIPLDAPPGVYYLAAGMYDRPTFQRLSIPGGTDRALLGPIWVGKPDPMPSGLSGRADRWPSAGVELVGYRVDQGQNPARLTLGWRAMRAPSRDYTVFVHLLAADGKLLGQADGPPARPLSTWEDGDFVVDERPIALPAGAASIALGLYEPDTGRRLRTLDGDAVVLPIYPP